MRISDWSSDVCSSDLPGQHALIELAGEILKQPAVGEQILVRHQRLPQRADGGEQLVEQRHRPAVVADLADRLAARHRRPALGRASCRERVCQYVSISVVAVSLKTKHNKKANEKIR